MNPITAYVVLNVLWFGVFVAAVFYLHWTPWCLAVPIVIHFTLKDLGAKKDGDGFDD